MPKDYCPFCPGSGRVPEDYDLLIYPNDFPSLSIPPPRPVIKSGELYRVEEARGICDVVLYTPDHNASLSKLSLPHMERLVLLWRDRFRELSNREEIKYVFIFENKGEVIGVTMPHPHGQIYAFPFIPPRVKTELRSSREYMEEKGRCLFCTILAEEGKSRERVVFENESFLAFIPFYARYPYEVHVFSKPHLQSLEDFLEEQIRDLARILKLVVMKYDNLFGFPFPYMMVMHQAPTDGEDYSYYHFHIEFYPPHRSKEKIKYPASCEFGAGTFINDTCAEEKAKELRETPPWDM